MNKAELIAQMAAKAGSSGGMFLTDSKADAEKALNAFTETVSETLASKEKVSLVGFGTFEAKNRAAREGRNPQTGETVQIPASVAPTFKAGKALKDKVNA